MEYKKQWTTAAFQSSSPWCGPVDKTLRPKAERVLRFDPDQRITVLRVHVSQLKILCAAPKTQQSQISRNKYDFAGAQWQGSTQGCCVTLDWEDSTCCKATKPAPQTEPAIHKEGQPPPQPSHRGNQDLGSQANNKENETNIDIKIWACVYI